jgi:signal transduction histidine kinase
LTKALLRRRAEIRLRKTRKQPRSATQARNGKADTQQLLHEVQVHQIELEMQNAELSRAAIQAEASARKFLNLFAFAPVGYVGLDKRGRIQELNFMAAKLLRGTRQELTGTLLIRRVATPDKAAFLHHLSRASESKTKVAVEVNLGLAQPHLVPVQLCSIHRQDPIDQEWHYLTAITDLSERKRAEEKTIRLNASLDDRVRQRTATIRRLAIELTLTEQKEKARLAHILHDHVQQIMMAAKYHLYKVEQKATALALPSVHKVEQTLVKAMRALRTLSVELSPPVLQEEGLSASLHWLASWVQEHHGLSVNVVTSAIVSPVSIEVSVFVYQAVRELLLNIVKHAHTTSANLSLDQIDGQLVIAIMDQGKGFDSKLLAEKTKSRGTLGLFSIQQRLAILGGAMQMHSMPGRGSRVTLRFPLRGPVPDAIPGKSE